MHVQAPARGWLTSTVRARRGEDGAAALSLLVVGMLLGLAIFTAMALPLTNATDAKAKSRNAADAAALAGVEHVKLGLRDLLRDNGWLGSWGQYGSVLDGGRSQAEYYAEQNGGTLVAYQPPTVLNGWEAYAKVRGRQVRGEWTYSEARARLDLPECRSEEVPEEEDEDDPQLSFGEAPSDVTPASYRPAGFTPAADDDDDDEDDDDDDEPPPPPKHELTCGGISLGEDLSLADLVGKILDIVDSSKAKLVD